MLAHTYVTWMCAARRCHRASLSRDAEVPQVLRNEMNSVCTACDQESSGQGRSSRSSASANALREEFKRDMNPKNPNFPTTLGALTEALKRCRANVLREAEERVRGVG